jgi:hypothetical protein
MISRTTAMTWTSGEGHSGLPHPGPFSDATNCATVNVPIRYVGLGSNVVNTRDQAEI